MSWRPGEAITCTGCGVAYQRNMWGQLGHPVPWCATRKAQARDRHTADIEGNRIREGVTFRGRKRSDWRR